MSARPERPPERNGLDAVLGRGVTALGRRVGALALAVVVLLVILGAVLSWRQYEDGKRRALKEMQARVVLAATVFDTYFAGQLAVLSSIATAPSVVSGDTAAMGSYFTRLQGGKQPLFTAGLGWIDRSGVTRVSAADPKASTRQLNVADRSFFKVVTAKGRPFVSEGLTTRVGKKRAVVMAVPTRDARGRLTGVLAGALELRPSGNDKRTTDLGYEGLVVIDRAGQELTLTSLARPKNVALLGRLRRGEGVLADTRGFDGSTERAVAYANSKAPGWTTAIDRPRSAVFASARRSLQLQLASISGAALVVLGIIGWALARARRDLESERELVRHWDGLAESLGDAAAAAEVSSALGAGLVTALAGPVVIVGLEADDRRTWRVWTYAADTAVTPDPEAPGVADLSRLGLSTDAPLLLDDAASVKAVLRPLADSLGADVGAVYALPLRVGVARPVGSLTLLLPRGRVLDGPDEALVAAHADRAARAVVRAGRFEREHDVAVSLQRSLLPEALPNADGVELAGRYHAGGAGLEVGGDWYDAVRRPDGIVHLTVGDVAGRGIPAAVLMGQLRNAFRALAYEHVSPVEIAQRLARHVPPGSMATAVLLSLDPFTGELRYVSTGHPPALVLDLVSGAVTHLDGASTLPLGWGESHPVVEGHLVLPSQTTLLAYTDGLVERRDAVIDDGIARVADLLRERPEIGAGATVDRLLDELVTGRAEDDDVALLALRISEVPALMRIEVPADPALLRRLRARIRAWLRRRGLDEDRVADTILAVSEACTNAIEHAYAGEGGGTIRITLEHRAGALHATIEDDGAWREPRPDPARGRGLLIIEGMMDTVAVEAGPQGTRVELELQLRRDETR